MKSVAGRGVSNAADTTLGLDMIREFGVVTNAFSADYGRAMGGVISVVTKSGTNEFRGSGVPFSPSISGNWSRSGNVSVGAEDRPNLRPGVRPEDIILGGSTRYFDPNAFVLQAPGLLGMPDATC